MINFVTESLLLEFVFYVTMNPFMVLSMTVSWSSYHHATLQFLETKRTIRRDDFGDFTKTKVF